MVDFIVAAIIAVIIFAAARYVYKAKKNGATVRKGGRADSFYFKDSR